MPDLKISADKHTREKLGLDKETVSQSDAMRIQRETKDSKEFRTTVKDGSLEVKRVLRD
jgi:hypothetical protein